MKIIHRIILISLLALSSCSKKTGYTDTIEVVEETTETAEIVQSEVILKKSKLAGDKMKQLVENLSEEDSEKIYPSLKQALQHFKICQPAIHNVKEWPQKDDLAPRYSIVLSNKVNSSKDLKKPLEQRPKGLKKSQRIGKIFNYKDWFVVQIISVASDGKTSDANSISRSYFIKKGTSKLYYWFYW